MHWKQGRCKDLSDRQTTPTRSAMFSIVPLDDLRAYPPRSRLLRWDWLAVHVYKPHQSAASNDLTKCSKCNRPLLYLLPPVNETV